MFSDDISVNAGVSDADYLDPVVMERMVSDIGRTLKERTILYELKKKFNIKPVYFILKKSEKFQGLSSSHTGPDPAPQSRSVRFLDNPFQYIICIDN